MGSVVTMPAWYVAYMACRDCLNLWVGVACKRTDEGELECPICHTTNVTQLARIPNAMGDGFAVVTYTHSGKIQEHDAQPKAQEA